MAISSFYKFQSFVEAVAEKKHNLGADQIVVALCAAAHAPVNTNAVLADLTQVVYTFCSSRNITTSSSSQTAGTYGLALTDLTLTASGGSVGPFRYAILYNDTAANDELIGWYDYGLDITLGDGEYIDLDFATTTITLA